MQAHHTSLPGPHSELHFLTIADAGDLIRQRKLSPVEYVHALLSRIDALDSQVNAFITKTAEIALAQARTAEREIAQGGYRGPLHGIPFALKDIYNTAGILTSGHSKICMENVPGENAHAAQRLLDAGAILMGKLATHEFASGGPSLDLPWPPARNPWNTDYFTGSSSSGSGAAVAAGFVPAALGSDTGGSIRIPAALCGVAGLKPTYGRVSRHGVMANSYTFDHAGPLAWTVEDCAILLECIAGHDPADPTSARRPVPNYRRALSRDIRGLRVGVVRHYWEEEGPVDAELAQAMEAAIEVLQRLGAKIGTARMRTRQEYNDVKMVIAKSEIVVIHDKELRERPQDFGADFLGRNLPGYLFTAADYVRAQRERRSMVDEMQPLYDEFDVAADREQRAGFAPRGPDRRGLLHQVGKAEHLHAVQRHGRSRARGLQRLYHSRFAAIHANRRASVRRGNGVARRPRLRAGDHLAPTPSASGAGCRCERTYGRRGERVETVHGRCDENNRRFRDSAGGAHPD